MKKTAVVFVVLFLSVSPVHAKFDPSFTWTTLETPHFLIHYHQGGEEIARKAAQIAEDVHARLVLRIKWEPKQKTEIVLVDAMDEANGMATVIPYNQMVLFLTPPLGQPGFATTPYDDWMRLLITHEYTHVLQLDMVTGGYGSVFQTLFGRSPLSFPNVLQPEWLIEGLAVYEETAQTSGGRGRSAGADMVLRMAVLEGPFPQLGQMTVFPDTWPSGDVPYLFGDSFTQFIADQYGRDELADLSLNYSGRGFPFLVNSTAKRTLGSYYGKIYREWRESLQEKYEKQRADVRVRGETPSTPLTRKGYETLSPVYSPDGRQIAYFESNGDEFPGIYLMDSKGTRDRKLVENVFPTSASGMAPAWSPDGSRLYYTKIEVVRNTNLYDDIYYYDLKKDREVRVTEGVRGRDPAPSPDGRNLLFVANRMGKTRIGMLDLSRQLPAEEKDIVWLTEEGSEQYSMPRWSPDGSKIAVNVWQPGGYPDIWILDSSGRKLEEVSHDRADDGAPAWSPDGRYVYFSSDRTGIFNIFAYEPGTGKLFQMTNVVGGAFSPWPSPDNKSLVFTSYSAKGYDVHAMAIDPASWKPAGAYHDPYPVVQYEERRFETAEQPYNPLPTLAPRFWLPWFGYSQRSVLGGFITYGQDVAERHEYILTGLYGPKTNHLWYTFDYLYDGLYPTIHLSAYDQDVTYTNLLQQGTVGTDYVEREQTYGLAVIVPLIKTQTQHSLSIGYQWKELTPVTDVIPGVLPWPGYDGPVPFQGVLASGRASYIFNSARRYNFSISPEQGRTIEMGYERFDKALGSDLEFNKYTADWHEYLNMPWQHHVLLVRAFAGTSTGVTMSQFPQGAFQLGGDMPGDITLSINDNQVYLRGYPADAFEGMSAALLSLEYRFPIWNIEQAFAQTPFFFRRLHGAVFAEAGNVWSEGSFHETDAKRSVGAELRMDTDFFYYFPITLRLGVAKGLDEMGEWQLIFNAWVPFGF